MAADPTWTRLFEGLAILTVLWWVWSAYAWLGNTAGSDEGLVRVVLLAAAAGMLVASLAVPHAFGVNGLLFGVSILCVRLVHLGPTRCSHVARRRRARHGGVPLAQPIVPSSLLLVLAGVARRPGAGALLDRGDRDRLRRHGAARHARAGGSGPRTSPSATG